MGDFIPPEELEKFMSNCNDAASQKAAKEAAEKARIQADNIGHKLLSKMGWKEGNTISTTNILRSHKTFATTIYQVGFPSLLPNGLMIMFLHI